MKVFSIFLSALLLSSIYVITNTPALAEEENVMVEAADKVSAASGNNRFVAWYDNTSGNYEILFRRSTDSGATWKPTVNLSTNPGPSYIPQIAVSGANVYVVWSQETTNNTLADVYVRVSTDNGATWGAKVKVSTTGTNFSPTPQVAVIGSNAYITWHDDGTGDIFVRRSTDNGATWKAVVNISNNAGYSSQTQIAVSGANVYLVWRDDTPGNDDILFRRSTDNGATWKVVVNLSNNAGDSFGPQIAVSGSNIYVVWYDNTPGALDVFSKRSTDNGATWKAVKNLSNNAGTSYSPRIAVSGSNVYVTWPDNTPGNYDVLLRRSTDNGATWKAVKNLTNNAGASSTPQITTVGSDVYIVWVDQTTGNDDIFLRRSADNGATWKAIKNLSNNAGFSYLELAA
jgi:hypothetical protein